MTKRLRVAHFGTGHTGTVVLRQILSRPDLELVAHLVHSPHKAGLDSGVIAGLAPVGVPATTDFDEFCELDADCVTYCATDFGRDVDEVIEQMCQILASGKNMVTTTFIRLVYPPSLPGDMLGKLAKACSVGGSTFFATGISPGFTVDALPVYCATLTHSPRRVRVAERILQGTYEDPLTFSALGFGATPAQGISDLPADHWLAHFTGTMQMLADGLGWQLDSVRAHQDFRLAEKDYSFPAGLILRGTVGSVRLRFDGIVDGEPRLQLSWLYVMPDDLADPWEPRVSPSSTAKRFTHITIEGDPDVSVQLELRGGELPGVTATAARAVSAIGAVCRAAPGVRNALDLAVSPQLPTQTQGEPT